MHNLAPNFFTSLLLFISALIFSHTHTHSLSVSPLALSLDLSFSPSLISNLDNSEEHSSHSHIILRQSRSASKQWVRQPRPTQTPAKDFNDNRSPRLACFGTFYQPLFSRLPLVLWHSDFSEANSSIIACFLVLRRVSFIALDQSLAVSLKHPSLPVWRWQDFEEQKNVFEACSLCAAWWCAAVGILCGVFLLT